MWHVDTIWRDTWIIDKWLWLTELTSVTNLMQQLWFVIINYLSVFRAPICPSSGVQVVCYCVWCSTLGVATVIPRSRRAVLCTVCRCWTPYAARWAYRCPEHVEIIYDNKSQLLHQVGYSRRFRTRCTQLTELFVCIVIQ